MALHRVIASPHLRISSSRKQMTGFILIVITIIAMLATSQAAVISTKTEIAAVSRTKYRSITIPIYRAVAKCSRSGMIGEAALFKCVDRRLTNSRIRRCMKIAPVTAYVLKNCFDFRTENGGGMSPFLYFHECLGIPSC